MITSSDRSPVTVRRSSGLYAYERALGRLGFAPVAGADEAGRGACAGPLVVGAAVLADGRRGQVPGLADSKLLTASARERAYDEVVNRAAAWSVVIVSAEEVDYVGLHRTNIEAMRRALARLTVPPAYVLTDGFPVGGLGTPGLAMWKGDQVAACIAAASVIAKVTRDRIMAGLHKEWPEYGFDAHKGYVTSEHQEALARYGPSPVHRRSYANVARAASGSLGPEVADGEYSAEPEVPAGGLWFDEHEGNLE